MPAIKEKDLMYFENKLFLPMVIKVLEKDLELINKLPFKFNRPYINKIENALKLIRKDLKIAEIYLRRNDMKASKWEASEGSTTYVFSSRGVEDHRKYLNTEIKTNCEELLYKYFTFN